MKKNMQGFTLIELMIVVAIIAILAAIALPAYQDFIKRSKVSEAIVAAGACKSSVAEFLASSGALTGVDTNHGCSLTDSQYVDGSALTVSATGVITVPVQGISGVTGNVILTPSTPVDSQIATWTCTVSFDKKFAPGNCRG